MEVESPEPFPFSMICFKASDCLQYTNVSLLNATQCFGPSLDQALSVHHSIFSSASTSLSLLPSGYWLAQEMLNEWVFCPSCCIFRASMALRYKSREHKHTADAIHISGTSCYLLQIKRGEKTLHLYLCGSNMVLINNLMVIYSMFLTALPLPFLENISVISLRKAAKKGNELMHSEDVTLKKRFLQLQSIYPHACTHTLFLKWQCYHLIVVAKSQGFRYTYIWPIKYQAFHSLQNPNAGIKTYLPD